VSTDEDLLDGNNTDTEIGASRSTCISNFKSTSSKSDPHYEVMFSLLDQHQHPQMDCNLVWVVELGTCSYLC
ncbi:hypothetical protein HDU76_007909, partial [Blyttiomyces sp. JEL0837]